MALWQRLAVGTVMVLNCACAHVDQTGSCEWFETSMKNYNKMLRWRELEQARKRYPQLESSIALAQENVKLREKGFREGLSTSLDLVDARLALARAEIDRAQTARDYVVALAELLAASGQSERFPEFAARADIRIARAQLSGTH